MQSMRWQKIAMQTNHYRGLMIQILQMKET
jgi:hypothetical protein